MLKIDNKYNLVAGIYKITCTANNKFYIGSSVDLLVRLREHISHLRKNYHHSKLMQRSFNKYGEKSFKIEILATLEVYNEEILRILEFVYIEKLKPAFNTITPMSINITERWKKKISESIKALYKTGYHPRYNTGRMYNIYNAFGEKVQENINLKMVSAFIGAKDYHYLNTLIRKYDGITTWKSGIYLIAEISKSIKDFYEFYKLQLELNSKTRFVIIDSNKNIYKGKLNYKYSMLKQNILKSENFCYEEDGVKYTLPCLPI